MTCASATLPIGSDLRELRLSAGLSQEKLAREVDCSTGYVRMLERRGDAPDPETSPVYDRVVRYLNDERRPRGAAVKASATAGPTDDQG